MIDNRIKAVLFSLLLAVPSTVVFATINDKLNAISARDDTFEPMGIETVIPTDDCAFGKGASYGGGNYLITRNTYGSGGITDDHWGVDSAIKFNISGFSNTTKVYSATLKLYYYAWWDTDPAGRNITTVRLLGDWNEETINWTNAPANDTNISAIGIVPATINNWMSINVTNDVQAFINGSKTNYGWRLIDSQYWGLGNIPIAYYHSKDNYTAENESLRPYLEINSNGTLYRPPTVTTNNATNVNGTNATLNGYLNEDGGESNVIWFEYGFNTSYGSKTLNQTASKNENFSTNVSSLKIGTLYHFRAVANNSDATVYGGDLTFFMSAQNSNVTTNSSTGITSTNATLNGYLAYDGGENCTVGFEYGLTTAYGTNATVLPRYIYAGGQSMVNVTQYYVSNMTLKSNASYAGTINSIAEDDNYIYIGGSIAGYTIYQYYKSNMTFKANTTTSYGGVITAVAVDSDYIYVGGLIGSNPYPNTLARQYWKSNMTFKANSSEVSGTGGISAVAQDEDYIYFGSAGGTVRQYWKSNMTVKANISYSASQLAAIAVDDTYLYLGGGGGINVVRQYWKSNTTFKAQGSAGDVRALAQDDIYIYAGGIAQTIYQLWKSNMTLKASVGHGRFIYAMAQDSTYVYAGGGGSSFTSIKQYWKSNMTLNIASAQYGDDVFAISSESDPYATGQTFYFNVTGLVRNTTYHYRAIARNSAGNSTGNDMTFTTLPELANVTTNNATGVTSTNATLRGTLTDDGGEKSSAWFEYGLTTGYGINVSIPNRPPEYIYIAGATTQKIYQYWRSNLTKKAETANYTGTIDAIAEDDDYVYAGGDTNQTVCQYWKSNMTKKSNTSNYGSTITAIAVDGTYVYVGGSTIGQVYQYWKSNMTQKANASYGGGGYNIRAISQDAIYIYVGGTTGTVYQIWKSDMTKKAETPEATQIFAIAVDEDYIYTGMETQNRINQYYKSNMTFKANTSSYGGTIRGVAEDTEYVYAVGLLGVGDSRRVVKYLKSDLSYVSKTDSINDFYAIADDENYTYSVGGNGIIYQHFKSNMTLKATSANYGGIIYAISLLPMYGTYTTGENFSVDVSGLSPGTLYHFRAAANNSIGNSTGGDKTFLTNPEAPTNLTVTVNGTGFAFSWTHGTGYNRSVVVGQKGSYPANPQSGTVIYNGTGNSTTHTGLTQGDLWFYRVWEYTAWGGYTQFSYGHDAMRMRYVVNATVNTIAASGVGPSYATLNGNVTNLGGHLANDYGFQYGLNLSYGNITNQGTTGYNWTLKASRNDGGSYSDMARDSAYLYATCGDGGIRAYSANDTAFTLIATMDDGGTYQGVWINGNYIYVACGDSGIRAYTFDGNAFTLIATQDDGSGYTSIWGDGQYIYVACYNDGIRAYTFNGTTFELKATRDDSSDPYFDVIGDGTYIYVANYNAGVKAYSFNGSNFTLLASQQINTDYLLQLYDLWYDDGIIYIPGFQNTGSALLAYTFNGTAFNRITYVGDDLAMGVWGDGTNIYTACQNMIRAHRLVNNSFLLLAELSTSYTYKIFGDNDFIYASSTGVGAYTFGRNGTWSFSENLTGLLPGTQYHFRAYVNNSYVIGYGADRTFNTTKIPPTVTTNSATGISSANATLQGALTNDGGENCTVRFEYGLNISYGTNTTNQTATTGQNFSFNAIGLLPNVLYHYRAYANNSQGNSTGSDKTFTTLIGAPNVTTNNATNVNATSATLNGYLLSDGGENCSVWFEFGNTTSYGQLSSIQMKNYGQAFNYTIISNFSLNTTGIILRPIANGTVNQFTHECNGSDTNWTNNGYWAQVDDEMSDANATYLLDSVGGKRVEFYRIANLTNRTGVISLINVSINTNGSSSNDYVFQCINVSGTEYDAPQVNTPSNWQNTSYNYIWRKNPKTGASWTWDDLNNLQIGAGANISSNPIRITQVFVTIEYNNTMIYPGTLIHYRAVANNTNATVYGNDSIFLTRPNQTTNLTAKTFGKNQINLTWMKGDGANRTYIERNTTGNWTIGIGTAVYNGSGTSYNDTGLIQNTTYYYQAWSYTEWNESGTWSRYASNYDLAYNTTQGAYAPNVTTNDATGITSSNATLQGALIADDGENCTVRFEYGLNTSYGTNTTNQTKATGQNFSFNITGLLPSTLYHYRAYANNSVGNSTGSDKTFTTLAGAPNVTTKNATGVWQTNATLQGNLINNGGENCTVRFEYGLNTSYGTNTTNQTATTGQNFSFNATGLLPGTLYHYRAFANNTVGSTTGNDVTFTTVSGPVIGTTWPNNITTSSRPTCYAIVNDGIGGDLTVKIYENTTGSWILQQTNITNVDAGPAIVYWYYANASQYGTNYWWKLNVTDGTGLSVEKISNFTTYQNFPPTVYGENPDNGSDAISASITVISVDITDIEGDNITYTIETDPYIGSTYAINTTSGTKNCPVSNLLTNTMYTWYVNATDGSNWTRKIFSFMTRTNNNTILTNKNPPNGSTDVALDISALSIDIEDPEGDFIAWTMETNPDIGSSVGTYDGNGTKYCDVSNVQSDVTYYWYVNVTDGQQWNNQTYHFTTTHKPTISNVYPPNGSMGADVSPICHITVNDADGIGDGILIYWYENTTGDWLLRQITQNVTSLPMTAYWNFTQANGYSTWYWWKVNVTDNKGAYNEEIFNFLPRGNQPPVLSLETPTNNSVNVLTSLTQLSVTVHDYEEDTLNWTIETNPNIGSNSGMDDSTGIKTCSVSGLQAGVTYTWFVNVTDGVNVVNNYYEFNTTKTPAISNPGPANSGYGPIKPICNVTVYDPDGGQVNVSFFDNTSGTWQLRQYGLVTVNTPQNVIWDRYDNATTYFQQYWWKVNVSDNRGGFTESIFYFTTNNPPSLDSPTPSNGSINVDRLISQLSINMGDAEGDGLNWTIQTNPNVGSNSGNSESNGTKSCTISNLEAGTVYTWFVNVTDGYNVVRQFYVFRVSYAPDIANPNPMNGSTAPFSPICNVTVFDQDGDIVDVKFYDNSTGSWVLRQTNSSMDASSPVNVIWDNYANANQYSTNYWWKVQSTDGKNCATEKIYQFTTMANNPPSFIDLQPENNSINVPLYISALNLTMYDYEGSPITWTIQISPNVGSASGINESNGTKSCSVSGLQMGVTYTWFINATDGFNWRRESYVFTTRHSQQITNPYPTNGQTNVPMRPVCNVTVFNIDDQTVNVAFYENATGSWILRQMNSSVNVSVPQNIVWDNFSAAASYSKTYWWRVNVSDVNGAYLEVTYHFTTVLNTPPNITAEDPTNQSTWILRNITKVSVTIYDCEGHLFNWTIHGDYIITNTSNGASNGTFYADINATMPYNHLVHWYVNATDGFDWRNVTYYFTTEHDIENPVINWVTIYPPNAKKDKLVTITANITDNEGINHTYIVFPTLNWTYQMYMSSPNIFTYPSNYSILGTYVFYVETYDYAGNAAFSPYYNFTIVTKEVTITLYTLDYVQKLAKNKLLVKITDSFTGQQVGNLSGNITFFLKDPNGTLILNSTNPTEITSGIYEQEFNITGLLGTYLAWVLINYNGSTYMDANVFEVRYEGYENVSDLTTRMGDFEQIVHLEQWNGTQQIISHINLVSKNVGENTQNTEEAGIQTELQGAALGTIFQYIFTILFTLGFFLVSTFLYGRRKAAKVAKKVAKLPSTVVSRLRD